METPVTRIFVIGDKKNEPERVEYLENYFRLNNMNDITYFQPSYKTNLTEEELKKYVPINQSLHNRPLRKGEISLFLNFIYLFEKILNEYKDGVFLILESDVIFFDSLINYLNTLFENIDKSSFDCISIGSGCDLVLSKDSDVFFQRMIKTRCTDSLLFTYNGIKKFYNYLTEFLRNGNSLNQPIDNFLETFFEKNNDFVFLWANPVICYQGSQKNIYNSECGYSPNEDSK